MPQGFTYWSDVSGVALSDSTHQWVHALPIGEYSHPIYGKLKFTPDRIRRFADSVKLKVRGIDPDIDYDHKLDPSRGRKAAGWVKDADAREDGLWLFVEWTPEAATSVQHKEYRYFSTEFSDEWEDSKGNKHTDVVLGGGLTNRPFVKDLVPINLSEVIEENQENGMDRKELAKLLGLSEDATDKQIKEAIESKNAPDLSKLELAVDKDGKVTAKDSEGKSHEVGKVEPPKSDEGKGKEGEEGSGTGGDTSTSAEDKELAKLAEENPAVAKMLSEHKSMQDRMNNLETATRLSEVSTQLSELGKDHKRALPPVVQDKLRQVMVQLPKKLSDEVADAMVDLMKVGVVELGERTPKSPEGKRGEGDDNVVAKYLGEIDRIMKEESTDEHKVTFREAADMVYFSNPDLHAQYLSAVAEGQTLAE